MTDPQRAAEPTTQAEPHPFDAGAWRERDKQGRFTLSEEAWRQRARDLLEWVNPKLRAAIEAEARAEAHKQSEHDRLHCPRCDAVYGEGRRHGADHIDAILAERDAANLTIAALADVGQRLVTAYEQFEGSHWEEEERAYRDLKAALANLPAAAGKE